MRTNNFVPYKKPKSDSSSGVFLKPARVVDVIIEESHPSFRDFGDIGAIRYRLLDKAAKESDTRSLGLAHPLHRNQFTYPLKNEIVFIYVGPVSQDKTDPADSYKTYYTSALGIWNHPHFNPHPDPETTTKYAEGGVGFEERGDIAPLLPHLGDTLIEGRYGQSIRMTGVRANQNKLVDDENNGSPLTIIRNGQSVSGSVDGYTPVIEDINNDKTSIYLTSDHTIPIEMADDRRVTFIDDAPEDPNVYRGAQAIINSDRIIFNAKEDAMFLSSATAISLSSETVNMDGTSKLVLDAPKIYIGAKAYKLRNAQRRNGPNEDLQEPAVKGGVNETVLLDLLGALRILVDEMSQPRLPAVYVPAVIKSARSIQDELERIETLIPTTKSNKVFIE